MKKQVKYIINDDEWTFSILPLDEYIEKHGSLDSYGVTDTTEQTVDFREDEFHIRYVRHELWHVHNTYMYMDSADLSGKNVEEMSADLFADRGEKIGKQAKEIYRRLNGKK